MLSFLSTPVSRQSNCGGASPALFLLTTSSLKPVQTTSLDKLLADQAVYWFFSLLVGLLVSYFNLWGFGL